MNGQTSVSGKNKRHYCVVRGKQTGRVLSSGRARASASPVQVGHHSSAPLLYLALGRGVSVHPAELLQGFVPPLAEEAGMALGAQPLSHSIAGFGSSQLARRHSLDILMAENVVLR